MAGEDRVVWDEGMMLAPQHFQQWERWVSAELRDRLRASTAFPWGFTSWELDRGALAGGEVAIRHASGLFADGTQFCCPEREPLPAARQVMEKLGPQQESITAWLALPSPVAGASAYSDAGTARPMVRRRERVADLARPEVDREIATASLNLSIRFDGETLDGFRTLPLARLSRATGGGVEVAADFVPPAMTIAAAPLVLSVLRQVAGMLTQKWSELAGKRRGGGGMAEASGLLLLHTAGDSIPLLRHCVEHGTVAPETAYLHLARLSAQLCTFHGKLSAADVPPYSHTAAGPCFQRLGSMLSELLGDAAPTRCNELPLEREGDSMFSARIPSPTTLTGGRLYLSVKADAAEEEVQSRLPSMLKISSKDRIQELLIRAVPGLPLRVVPQPPPAIPVQAGRSYFALEPTGEHWDAIASSLTLAIHVSPGLDQLRIELLAVKE